MSDVTSSELGESMLVAADALAGVKSDKDSNDGTATVTESELSTAVTDAGCDVRFTSGVIKTAQGGGACSELEIFYDRLVVDPIDAVEQYLRRAATLLMDPSQKTVVFRTLDEMSSDA